MNFMNRNRGEPTHTNRTSEDLATTQTGNFDWALKKRKLDDAAASATAAASVLSEDIHKPAKHLCQDELLDLTECTTTHDDSCDIVVEVKQCSDWLDHESHYRRTYSANNQLSKGEDDLDRVHHRHSTTSFELDQVRHRSRFMDFYDPYAGELASPRSMDSMDEE
jgi:hypothetical protein